MIRPPSGARSAAILSSLLLLACTAGSAAERPATTLSVFAAASLADTFRDIGGAFEKSHAGLRVRLNLAGSQQLALQIEQGAVADVFASADDRWMDHLRADSLLVAAPAPFAHNLLVVIVPRTNPARIRRLQDLARRGVKVVLGAEAVPVGTYSRQALQNLSRASDFSPDFAARVLSNVVSEEENVKSVLGKVQLGEADAGIVYASDVTPAFARFVRVFEIPPSANVVAAYPIAVLRGSKLPEAAREFVALVLSAEGQEILKRRGLIPVRGDAR